jgi:CspA family cold shock protein
LCGCPRFRRNISPFSFGFITPDEGRRRPVRPLPEIKTEGFKSLQENQKVSFDVKMGPKGKQAANIKPV